MSVCEFSAPALVSERMQGVSRDFRLDDWVVRTQRCCIERADESKRLKPKAMQVLEALARARGAVVSRNELFDSIWPGQAVSDDALTNCVVELRKAFDDSAKSPQIIETIPKKGFRILTEVEAVSDDAPSAGAASLSVRTVNKWLLILPLMIVASLVVARIGWIQVISADTPTSIAVLPFVDMSSEGDQEYFSDGLSEELINRLTQVNGLQVTGRTSSFYFKGRNEDLRSIGEQLSVSHVVEGSVRKSDDRLRISAQLIDVDTGFHLWSESYDRQFEDIFAVQQDIAESVATALSATLSVGDVDELQGGTDNVDALDAVMLGNASQRELTPESTLQAIEHYEKATELDPEFAHAWGQLANAYSNAPQTLVDSDPGFWSRLADGAIAQALRYAPDSESLLRTAADIEIENRNWGKARRLFEKAWKTDKSEHPKGSTQFLDLLAKTGHVEEALRSKERFRLVDPLHPHLAMYLGHLYLSQGKTDDALAELEKGYALDGFDAQVSVEGLVAALASGDPDLAVKWLRRAVKHQQPSAKGVHTAMLERFGDRDRALDWLHQRYASRSVPDYYAIVWGSYYGDRELALQAMRRSPDLWAFWTPLTRSLRTTAEFRAIVDSIGLVDYWREYGWNDYCQPLGEIDFRCS